MESNNCSSSKQATAKGPDNVLILLGKRLKTLNQLLLPPYLVDSAPLGGQHCFGETKFEMTLYLEQTI